MPIDPITGALGGGSSSSSSKSRHAISATVWSGRPGRPRAAASTSAAIACSGGRWRVARPAPIAVARIAEAVAPPHKCDGADSVFLLKALSQRAILTSTDQVALA